MTNREKLNGTALYDLLCMMNDKSMVCVLQLLDKEQRIRCDMLIKNPTKQTCHACIANWLNSKYDGRW